MTWNHFLVTVLGFAWIVGCNLELVEGPTPVELDETMHHAPLFNQQDPSIPKEEIAFEYNGVDLLFVVDNSMSMLEEQTRLASAVFSLAAALSDPYAEWPYPEIGKVRIGFTTTDMGRQYESGSPEVAEHTSITVCDDEGDKGAFWGVDRETLYIAENEIPCVDGETWSCPIDWVCTDLDAAGHGTCAPGGSDNTVDCDTLTAEQPFFEFYPGSTDSGVFSTAVACGAPLGTYGCGLEQQLKAATIIPQANLEQFLTPGALLAVFVITDEDDCSIDDAALFDTPEFSDPSLRKLNVACNIHEELLVPVAEIRERLIDAKGGDEHAVLFGALAGMPTGATCEGGGHNTADCLGLDEMQFVEVTDTTSDQITPKSVCTLEENFQVTTDAAPGRRFVELAQEFSEYGYTYSICNDNYHGVMEDFARQILRAALPFEPIPKP